MSPGPLQSQPARNRVVTHVIERAKRFPEVPRDRLATDGLDPRDARLASAIDHTVARSWITLRHLIQSRLDREWERVQHEVRAVLLTGSAQIFYLDRVPDHAIVHHAVEWTKQHGSRRTAGFINGVLRASIRLRGLPRAPESGPRTFAGNELPLPDGRVVGLTEPVFAEDPIERLAQQTSHPASLLRRWISNHDESTARAIALHSMVDAPLIVCASREREEIEAPLAPHDQPGFAIFTGDHSDLLTLLEHHPTLRVQDPTSALPVMLTQQLAPRLIADLCAGLGTKTHQLAQLHPDATIIASDVDPHRIDVLRRRFAGAERIRIVPQERLLEHARRCDLVLLDVPCSNTGVLARRVEAKYRFSAAALERLIALQRQIIADAIPLLAEHGSLLYATCSLETAENEAQAAWIERWHRLRRTAERRTLPHGLPGDAPSVYRDGGYAVLLQRK